jgi:hypothetical protein
MNGVLAQTNGGTRNRSNNKGGHEKANKFGSIIYCCFICNSIKHKIYNYPHKDIAQAMSMKKVVVTTTKKGNVIVNMVLVVITFSQILENVVFKEKIPFKNKILADSQKEKIFQRSFEKAIKDIQHKEPPKDMHGANAQTSIKANVTRNFGSNIKNLSIRPTSFTNFIKSTKPTNFTSSTKFTSSTISIRNINAMGITGSFSILEDITQQLLENKYTLTLGQSSRTLRI